MSIFDSCHLITVLGGKGGVGKSVFAANLAITLLQEMRAPTLLIDMDQDSCGDQNIILGLRPTHLAHNIAKLEKAITARTVPSLVESHSSGISYIGSVMGPEEAFDVPAKLFRKQLHSLSQHFKFIVADLGTQIGSLQMGLIEDSSVTILVTTPEILAVNQTKKAINKLLSATVPSGLLQIVLNQVDKNSLSGSAIGQSLQCNVLGMIPQDDATAFYALQSSKPFVQSYPNADISAAYHGISRKLTGGLLQRLKQMSRPKNIKSQLNDRSGADPVSSNVLKSRKAPPSSKKSENLDPLTLLKRQIHSLLIQEMDLKKDLTNTKGDPRKEQELQTKTQRIIAQLTDRLGQGLSREDRSRVIKEVLNESLGLGPLEELLEDPTVSEIMVNGFQHIYVEKGGKLELSHMTFTSNLQLKNVIERIVTPLGRRIDEKTPYVDARLQDGSRVNAVIEPLSIDGPALTIRKFPQERITIRDYVERFHSITKEMANFLKVCVEQGLNVIISGGTGTGKTTLLNVLSAFIPANERIVTIEDAAELSLKQDHVVRLETRPANMEGAGAIEIRDLVKNALRMRPDRIIVGECRDGAALDMLSAMNTGHDGSMTTVHANNPREATSRLENLCLMAGMDLPAKAIREQISSAVNLIVQISRLSDGSRKISSITEVVGMQGDTITLQEVFRFKEEGFDKNRKVIGRFQAMGLIPTFIEKFEKRGVSIPRNLFTSGGESPTKPGASSKPTQSSVSKLRRPSIVKKTGSGGKA